MNIKALSERVRKLLLAKSFGRSLKTYGINCIILFISKILKAYRLYDNYMATFQLINYYENRVVKFKLFTYGH